jgi:ribosome recycling factor
MAELNNYITRHKTDFEAIIEHLKKELGSLRTGRAQSALVDNLLVEAYGTKQPLKQLAGISIQDPKTISIEPWDKTILKDVEKAIGASNLGLSVINLGGKILAKVSMMTEENRKELIKVLGKMAETAKINVRQIRDKAKEEIIKAEKDNDITQDDRYKFVADLDNFVTEQNKKIIAISEEKETEIMTV